jgi:hypothetical protein
LQTPHRFRTKRQLWTFSGLGIETHSSADHRYVDGRESPIEPWLAPDYRSALLVSEPIGFVANSR